MSRAYKDNAYNRRVGRVGMPVGSCVISNGSDLGSGFGLGIGSGFNFGSSGGLELSQKTYVDNAYNRGVGRVGMPHGTHVISKYSPGTDYDSSKSFQESPASLGKSESQYETPNAAHNDSGILFSPDSVYKDNKYNRQKGRVGELKGTAVYTRDGFGPLELNYVDNKLNQKLGRVGMPRGSMPVHKGDLPRNVIFPDKETSKKKDHCSLVKKPDVLPEFNYYRDQVTFIPDVKEEPEDDFLYQYRRDKSPEVQKYSDESRITPKEKEGSKKARNKKPIVKYAFEEYNQDVDFNELILQEKIGSGSFGKVYKASWKKSTVAVKKFIVQRVSRLRIKDFKLEIRMHASLKHHNIVQVFGACTKTPNLCIIMELMETSLFEAIHMAEDTDFTENERKDIMRQTAEGLLYLHQNNLAHRDLKTANVLLNFDSGIVSEVKLTDMGLFVIKTNTESSQSCETPKCIGTPRYSAPEVLQGKKLTSSEMQMADVYSLGLLMFEVIFEEEPFYDLSYQMLVKQVGDNGLTPDIPDEDMVSEKIIKLLRSCWYFRATKRLDVQGVLDKLDKINKIYPPRY